MSIKAIKISNDSETIVAQATPQGRGGIGIVRVSGPDLKAIAMTLLGFSPRPRYAHYGPFYDATHDIIDIGIALYFPAPHSFTGDDILELQGHGGPVVIAQLIARVIALGARLAEPGEFSKIAFLRGKLDLAQAEAVSDLIAASSIAAGRAAVQSLQGVFSRKIDDLVARLTQLRVLVEGALDFPDEDIDFLSDARLQNSIELMITDLKSILANAQQGSLLRDGMQIVLAGSPNSGKSSLLNQLAQKNSAIVTDIAGTTRDLIHETIHLDGLPLHITDTAGLRDTDDCIEQEGVRRACEQFAVADRVLLLVDARQNVSCSLASLWPTAICPCPDKVIIIRNKIDLYSECSSIRHPNGLPVIALSAKTGEGVTLLGDYLKECMGYQTSEQPFIARQRHITALTSARDALQHGQQHGFTLELVAEDLARAQAVLGEITGKVSSDALLGEIFSSFCIGK